MNDRKPQINPKAYRVNEELLFNLDRDIRIGRFTEWDQVQWIMDQMRATEMEIIPLYKKLRYTSCGSDVWQLVVSYLEDPRIDLLLWRWQGLYFPRQALYRRLGRSEFWEGCKWCGRNHRFIKASEIFGYKDPIMECNHMVEKVPYNNLRTALWLQTTNSGQFRLEAWLRWRIWRTWEIGWNRLQEFWIDEMKEIMLVDNFHGLDAEEWINLRLTFEAWEEQATWKTWKWDP